MITQCSKGNLFGMAIGDMKPASQLLDIGPGIRPFNSVPSKFHICCEPFIEYTEVLKSRFPDFAVINMGWKEVVEYFPTKSVDTIILSDVIEHLEKDIGFDLLLKTLPIAKKQVAIFTTLGFFEQSHPDGIDAWGYHGGEWQTHRSGWYPEDFPNVEGGSWKFYVCPDFHHVNNKQEVLPVPKGAFWAIWTID